MISTHLFASYIIRIYEILPVPLSYCSILYENGEKEYPFCDTVDTTQQKKVTKTEAFENALQSGYLHKRRLLKTLWISLNAQN